jgi:hypothetical protein
MGQPNGHIDGVLLVQLLPDTASLARLHHTVARGWFALADAALKAGGWTLWWTFVADTYRTYEVQLAVFLARYEPVSQTTYNAAPSANRKRWPAAPSLGYASEFWIKKNIGTPTQPKYPATAAVPGTSPHGWGCAIDGALKTSAGIVGWTPALDWLIANARRFGFAWSLQSEPWHIQWVEGDVIPQAVLDFENQPDLPPPPSGRITDMYIVSYRLDRWPGPHIDRVGLDSIEHAQDGDSIEIDKSAGVPMKELDRAGYMSLLRDRGRRHVSIDENQQNTQDPFGSTYANGDYNDVELSALWRAQQR